MIFFRNKVTSLFLLHIHTYDLILWIKLPVCFYYIYIYVLDLWIRLPVCFFYIYIHMIWFYKISYQFVPTTYTGMKFDFKITLTSNFLHTYIGNDFINKIASFRLLQKPTCDLTLWINLPFCFYYIYIRMIWFYE